MRRRLMILGGIPAWMGMGLLHGATLSLAGCGPDQHGDVAGGGGPASNSGAVGGPTTAARTPTTPGVGGQSGTGDPRTTGSEGGYAQATSVASGGTGGASQSGGLTSGSAGATPGVGPAATPGGGR
ncbi:MAG TPA: hypothetical protein VHS99_08725 [Chloroflexota bacterium]|jgi:hypothetical protein|nr:hypothetical protein [Chloroflexota bacterium]